jgi:alcohol dehydrogenase class IV
MSTPPGQPPSAQRPALELRRWEFAAATEIVFGAGSREILPDRIRREGARALVVTGGGSGRNVAVLDAVRLAGVEVAHWPLGHEPTIDDARAAAGLARDQAVEVVVGIGGGSTIDLAKAVAALVTNGDDPLDYLEVIGRGLPLVQPPLPFIAVPTTAGAGAEVTRNAVLISPEEGVKASLRSPLMSPRLAVVDPELTLTLPPEVTAATGMDALAQLLEPYVSSRANPITDPLCLDGLGRVARSLRRAWTDGADLDARTGMSLAALFGGLALANAALGAVHGFASAIGGRFDAPHGAVCAALLPAVVRVNIAALAARGTTSAATARYVTAARVMTGHDDARAEDLVALLQQFRADLAIPGLRAYGVGDRDTPAIIEAAARASSMRGNPVALNTAELHAVLDSAL